MSERVRPRIIRDENGHPWKYQILVHLWSDGGVSFNDELCRVDFDGDLVDSKVIEWSEDGIQSN